MSQTKLSGLFLGLLVAPALCWAVEPDANRAKAMAEIRRVGGDFKVDENSPGKPVIGIYFIPPDADDPHPTDATLVHLKEFKELQVLWILSSMKITDAGLVHLEGLTNLQELNLGCTAVTDAGLNHLKELSELRRLYLEGCTDVTDAGLARLKGLTKLEELDLFLTRVTDAGLANLAGLTQLRRLDLRAAKVTDAGLRT